MNGVQTRFKCKLDVKRCKRFVFPPSSLLPRSNALKTKAIRYFQTDRTLTRIVSPPLIVNEQLRTTAPHVWALGDVKGGEMYDYLSIDDSRIILNHLFGNKERSVDDRNPVPYAIFTDPPMAHIGLTEEEAMKRGYPIKISRLPASAIPRARTLQNMDGMLKAIVNTDTEKILGCSLFCVDAPELINLVAFAMKTGQKSSALRNFIFTHPSMSEGLNELFKAF